MKRMVDGGTRRGRKPALLHAAAALLMTAATVASAQDAAPPAAAAAPNPVRDIRVGDRVSSTIDSERGRGAEVYRLHLDEGQSVRIQMDSPTDAAPDTAMSADGMFDTFLELRSSLDGEPLAANDDRGDGTLNSQITFSAVAAGDYFITARPLSSGNSGRYVLKVAALPPVPPPVALTGQDARGELGETSPVRDIYGNAFHFAAYSFEGRRNERVQLDLSTNSEGRALELISPGGATVAQNILEGGVNARLFAVLPEDGRYIIRVMSPQGTPTQYILHVERADAARFAPPQRLSVGQSVSGSLSLSNPAAAPPGQALQFFYSLYALRVRGGEPVTVQVEAVGFNPIVEGGDLSALGFAPMVTAGDSDANATLVLMPLRTGTAYLRVRSASPDTGTFRLTVENAERAGTP